MNARIPVTTDLTRTMLAVLFIGALIAACSWILLPFLTSFLWATTLVVTTWPVMLGLQGWLGGKRWLAVTVGTVLLLLVVIVPLSLAVAAIIGKIDDIAALGKSLAAFTVPPPPGWVGGIPIAGPKVAATWGELAALPHGELSARLAPYAGKALNWFSTHAGTGLKMFLEFFLTVIISAILSKTVRSVALGIVVTAIIQTSIGGIGLVIAGVPAPGLLIAVMFMLGLAQIGSAPVLIPAVIWVYAKDGALWGTILLVVSILSIVSDNVIRPVLIRKGADLPLVMIFAGVIGGLVAFGIIGLFIGPIVLAVSYTLLESWVLGNGREEEVGEGAGLPPPSVSPREEQ